MWQETVSPSVSNRTIVLLYKINMLPMWGGGGGGERQPYKRSSCLMGFAKYQPNLF